VSKPLSEAEAWLLQEIRAGNQDGWQQLVDRFQGRLLAFARRQLPQTADADDIVQETFLGFLQTLSKFRESSSLETWLFQILRRRVADFFRRRGARGEVILCGELVSSPTSHGSAEPKDHSASWYVRREEERRDDYLALTTALLGEVEKLKRNERFEDLQVIDLLLFAQHRNRDVAEQFGLSEKAVALKKHRFIEKLRDALPKSARDAADSTADDLLTSLWADFRPSCPKRTTLGKFQLGTLTPKWDEYVAFHLETLSCQFCSASLDDLAELASASQAGETAPLRDRIMQSTVGFFRPE
jgi:RNA polymerase sigma factor (sigma-70 family)